MAFLRKIAFVSLLVASAGTVVMGLHEHDPMIILVGVVGIAVSVLFLAGGD